MQNMSLIDQLKCALTHPHLHEANLRKFQNLDFLIPPVVLLLTFYFSTFGLLFTFLFLFILLPVSFCLLQTRVGRGNKINSHFFYVSWTVSSFAILLYVFEFVVVPFLEITIWENYTLLTFASISVGIVFFLRYRNQCDVNIDDKPIRLLFYNPWIATNVQVKYFKLYILSLVSIICALFFDTYLSVTTICHTYLQFDLILVPDDCSEIYFDANLSISFVCALYAAMLSFLIFYSLVKILYKYKFTNPGHHYSTVSSS